MSTQPPPHTALVIGASSGIGEAIAHRLVAEGWSVIGMSRRAGIQLAGYRHVVADVRSPEFASVLEITLADIGELDVCIYCAGIGEPLALPDLKHELDVFETNLMGAVKVAEAVIPRMIARGRGHVLGLSSQADRLPSAHAPSYAASKAGLSSYLEGLALACRPHGVAVTNVRLGFVDTAMAKAPHKPFMVSADHAAAVVLRGLERRPIRVTYPKRMAVLLWFFAWSDRLRIWFSWFPWRRTVKFGEGLRRRTG
jgi:NAD(P)-dependent dehydrogenase (short-subunit alcohol dehydrogenase family)